MGSKKMREFQEFDNWATTIVNSAIFEAKKDMPIKREIPQTQDIVYQATRKYPDRDTDQALSLFLADKLEDFDRRDLEQNAVINAQRRENSKLNTNLTRLQQELETIETNSEQTDAEIQRLKTLSGKLSTDIEQRIISARDIERALAQVEELRNKPGMSEEKYEELKKKIESAQKNRDSINPEEFKKFTDQINKLNSENKIENEQIAALTKLAADLQSARASITGNEEELVRKLIDVERRIGQETQSIEDKIDTISNKEKAFDDVVRSVLRKVSERLQKLENDKNNLPQSVVHTGEPPDNYTLPTTSSSEPESTPASEPDYDAEPELPNDKIIHDIRKKRVWTQNGSRLSNKTGNENVLTLEAYYYDDDDDDDDDLEKPFDWRKTDPKILDEYADYFNIAINQAPLRIKEQMCAYKIILSDDDFVNEAIYAVHGLKKLLDDLSLIGHDAAAKVLSRRFEATMGKYVQPFSTDRNTIGKLRSYFNALKQTQNRNTDWDLDWATYKSEWRQDFYQLMREFGVGSNKSTERAISSGAKTGIYAKNDEEELEDFVKSGFAPTQFDEDKNIKESINKMVDNIIGKDVARWIK